MKSLLRSSSPLGLRGSPLSTEPFDIQAVLGRPNSKLSQSEKFAQLVARVSAQEVIFRHDGLIIRSRASHLENFIDGRLS